jgi:hypothetical protein
MNIKIMVEASTVVGFEVSTAVTMKSAVCWAAMPCGFIVN